MTHRLSKSLFIAGVQCHKLLWWKVHEPDAKELQADKALQDRFDQGNEFGELARKRFPGGVLIDLPHHEERLAQTQEARSERAPSVFEATFVEKNTFVAVDVLERLPQGFHLIEVKASTKQKPEHIPDVAVQLEVLRAAGIDVKQASVMHLNPEFRSPDRGDLCSTSDVTAVAEERRATIDVELEDQMKVLRGSTPPDVGIGSHCLSPHECPFLKRCWPEDRDHISKLYRVGPKKMEKYFARGITRISQVPGTDKIDEVARRQITATRENRRVVEPGLTQALSRFSGTLGFLDFETVSRAIPVWPGLPPWGQVPVQFSYHEQQPDGALSHDEWLAEGPEDPRSDLANALIEATGRADKVLVYSSFEKRCITDLQEAVPELRTKLEDLKNRLIDLRPTIRDYVYDPAFEGSLSIKDVLQPLVPELSYKDLDIADGSVASAEIARLLLRADEIPRDEQAKMRENLLKYCKRDTWAMVKLLESLRKIANEDETSRDAVGNA